MYLALTTSFNPGDHDAGKTYTHVKIGSMNVNPSGSSIIFSYTYGEYDGVTWTPGLKAVASEFTGAAYDVVAANVATASEPLADHVTRAILEKLVADGDLVGTIVP